jgi:hypothetical protein
MQRIVSLLLLVLVSCQEAPQKEKLTGSSKKSSNRYSSLKAAKGAQKYEIITLLSANGWAYQIRQNGKLVIDQPTIPGRPGNLGFQTEEDAIKVAELVKAKLQAKVFPPSISEADLQNLNIH